MLEIIAGKSNFIRRVSQPLHVVLYFLYKLVGFFVGVGVVVAQEAEAVVALGRFEIDSDGLDVSDVQVTVGLRRKAEARPSCCFFEVVLIDFLGVTLFL